MATLVPIGNLRGPIGPQGVQGIPGTGGLPADDAVAGYLSTPGTSETQRVADARYGATMHAPAHGVVGDGAADDAPALQALLNTAAAVGASVTLGAGTTVRIASTITPPSGTRLHGNGATVAKATTLAAIAFIISAKQNILVENLRVNGSRSAFVSSEHQHGFYIVNGSECVTLRDVEVYDCNGDGIYVGDQTAPSRNIVLEKVDSHGNNRQGMSISHVSGFKATNSRFTATSGTNPQGGVDVEPNADGVVCEDIQFVNCTFAGNGHFGFVFAGRTAPTARQGGVELAACTVISNGTVADTFGGGVNLRAARDFTMTGGTIRGNQGPGVLIDWTTSSRGIKLLGVTITENSRHGLFCTSGVDDIEIIGCTIRDNGHASPNTYPGIIFNPAIASSNIRVGANTFEGTNQRYSFQTATANAAISRLSLFANAYISHGTGPRALADDTASRLDLDMVLAPSVTGSRGGNAAITSLLTQLAARGLIVNNTTA
ncbi:right-handed parallel beta-helix repeat-containing protein [Microbacterium sp. 2RAF4]|uniref:right-handed parallel beta-helix repeat-containing protein n=1 Tax=Microbacterium sp. 2RAF4 TaxID=3232999 RepID=UPI003F94FE9C